LLKNNKRDKHNKSWRSEMKTKRQFDSANWVAKTQCATTTNGRL